MNKNAEIIIAIDCMGGDYGPEVTIAGVSLASEKNPKLFFKLYGIESQMKTVLAKSKLSSKRYSLHHKDMSISMKEKPTSALRKGLKDSSMAGAIEAVKNKEADAALSAGNTGALTAFSILILKRSTSMERPAIVSLWPSVKPEKYTIMLDAGADLDASNKRLLQLSICGEIVAQIISKIDEPKVAILNIGEEDIKGMENQKSANKILQQNQIIENYCGFAEANEILSGNYDVLVTNGYVGNMILKTVEGIATHLANFVRQNSKKNIFMRLIYILAIPYLLSVKKLLNTNKFNGGVLVGLNGTVVKSHGNADTFAFYHSILRTAAFCKSNFINQLNAKFNDKSKVIEKFFSPKN